MGLGIALNLFFLEIGRNYVSIIVDIIISITVLKCCLLWIFLSIRRLPQLIECIGVSPPLKNITSSFFPRPMPPPTPQYHSNAKPPYTATESFVIHIKTEDSYKGIADDVKKWFDNVNKANGTKERVVKIILKFNDYKNCLFMNETILKLK